MNLEEITHEVNRIARETGLFIREERKKFTLGDVEVKGLNSLVSYVDKEAEKRIVRELRDLVPNASIIGEEDDYSDRGDYTWIIDPLDGTTNFVHGIPTCAVSIALMKGTEHILGTVYEVSLDECFYAWRGGGAWLNGSRIHVSRQNDFSKSLIATGFPYYDFRYLQEYLELLSQLMKQTHGLRRLGSAATDLAYVACGRFEGFYEYGLSPWDVAAGALIVREAGGTVTDFSNGEDFVFGKEIIADNGHTHTPLQNLIETHIPEVKS
jgi:myo-inositol-1(or 4)-monophosphatase